MTGLRKYRNVGKSKISINRKYYFRKEPHQKKWCAYFYPLERFEGRENVTIALF